MGQEESVPAEKPKIQLHNETACRHLTLVAPAGTDCKELMNRISIAIRDGKIEKLKGKIVVLLDREVFSATEKLMPSNAILGCMFADSPNTEMIKGFEWMIKHPAKIVFIIYSLDDFASKLERKRPLVRYFKPATPDAILHNILSGNLFSESRIISSVSMDMKMLRKIHLSVLPDHCLVLDGVSKNSVVLCMKEFLDSEGNPDTSAVQSQKSTSSDLGGLVSDDATSKRDLRGTRTPTAARTFCKSILNEDVYNRTKAFTTPHDMAAKREILIKRLKESLRDECDEERRLELYHALYEGRTGTVPVIQSSIHEIDLSEVSMSLMDVVAVTFIMKTKRRLRRINLRRCDIDTDKMSKVAQTALETNIKIDELEVAGNQLGPRAIYLVGKMVLQCKMKVLLISDCGLESEHIEKFVECTHNAKVQLNELDISSNNLGTGGMFHLGKLIKQCKIKIVDASNCGSGTEHARLQNFIKATDGTKVYYSTTLPATAHGVSAGPGMAAAVGRRSYGQAKVEILNRRHNATFLVFGQSANLITILPRHFPTFARSRRCAGCRVALQLRRARIQEALKHLLSNSSKMDSLSLTDLNHESSYFPCVLDLLPLVKKELCLRGWKVSESERKDMQKKLNSVQSSALVVHLSHGIELKAETA